MKKIVFFILLILSQKTNAQSDEVVFNQFYNALDKLNYTEAMSFYPAMKDALDKRYSYGDTNEFNIRFELFSLAKKIDSVGLMLNEIERIEYLINKNYRNKKEFTPFIYNIYLFYRDQKDYQKCESLLNQAIQNQMQLEKKECQDMAILLSDFAYIQGRLGNIELEAQAYLEAMPMIYKFTSESYLISKKFSLSCALFNLGRFSEQIKYGNECYVYYKYNDADENKLSQMINLYQLAVSSDSIGEIDNAIKYSSEFLNLAVKHHEFGLDQYVDNISTGFGFLTQDVEQIVACREKYLAYYKQRNLSNENSIEYQKKVIDAYYNVSLHAFDYVRNNSDDLGYKPSIHFDIIKSISFAREGLAFCENNKMFENDNYFELQLLLVQNLIDLKSPEIQQELKKSSSILKKYFKKDVLKLASLNYWNSAYLQSIDEINKAEQLLLDLEKTLNTLDNSKYEVLSLLYKVLSDLNFIYFDKGDLVKSQYYNNKSNKIGESQVLNLNDFADKNDLKTINRISNYSDSLSQIMDEVIRKFMNNTSSQLSIEEISKKLTLDLSRKNLTSEDKWGIFDALEYIYNKSDQNILFKDVLYQKSYFLDSLNFWTDSLKIHHLISLANVESRLYNHNESIRLLESILKNHNLNSSNYLNTIINNLALKYQDIGNDIKSMELLDIELKRLNSKKEINSDLIQDKILTLNNIGELSLSLKEYKSAYNYLESAYQIAKNEFSTNSFEYYHQLLNYLDLIMFSDKDAESQKLINEVDTLSEVLFDHRSFDYYNARKLIFVYYYFNGNYSKADLLFENLISSFNTVYYENGKGLNSKEFLQYHLFFLSEFSLFFEYGIKRNEDREDFLEEALNLYLAMTKLLNKREKVSKSKDNVNSNLVDLKANYFDLLQLSVNNSEDLMMKIDALKKQIDSMENNYFLSMSNVSFKGNGELNKLRSNLGDNEALVMNVLHHAMNYNKISILEDTSYFQEGVVSNYVFVIEKNKPLQFDKYTEENFDLESINSDFISLTRSLDNSYDSKSKIVSNAIHPTLKRIENVKNVYIYPTDFLSWLNLDVLRNMSGDKYEIDNKEFIYVIDPCDINFRDVSFKPSSITFFGGADYNMNLDYHEPFKNLGMIGVQFDRDKMDKEKKVLITRLVPNFPAENADVRVGDQILKVNGVDLDTMKYVLSVYELLMGEIGTEVTIEILRENKKINKVLLRKDKSLLTKSNYSYLPGTLKEVNGLSDYLNKNSKIKVAKFTEKLATEDNLKSNLSTDILHLATHSFMINREKQIKNYNLTQVNGVYAENYYGNQFFDFGIVFAGVNKLNLDFYNGRYNNGFLYAGEIQNLDLEKVKLVVLSSCESGLANDNIFQTTQGIIGSLAASGAKNAIVSLWKVDDEVTQQFMLAFYKNLMKNLTISEALRQTKLEIKKIHPEPYYWAPFVHYRLN